MANAILIALILSFTAALWLAAAADLRTRRIPNEISLATLAFWPAVHLLDPTAASLGLSLIIPVLAFLVGFFLWNFRILGGGDVKLFAITVLWVGPDHALVLTLVTALAGGFLGLLALKLREFEPAMVQAGGPLVRHGLAWLRAPDGNGEIELPYGVAIALGGTVALYQKLSALNLGII